jgi:hypothetical protein
MSMHWCCCADFSFVYIEPVPDTSLIDRNARNLHTPMMILDTDNESILVGVGVASCLKLFLSLRSVRILLQTAPTLTLNAIPNAPFAQRPWEKMISLNSLLRKGLGLLTILLKRLCKPYFRNNPRQTPRHCPFRMYVLHLCVRLMSSSKARNFY